MQLPTAAAQLQSCTAAKLHSCSTTVNQASMRTLIVALSLSVEILPDLSGLPPSATNASSVSPSSPFFAVAALCLMMTLQNSENSISPLLSSSTCRQANKQPAGSHQQHMPTRVSYHMLIALPMHYITLLGWRVYSVHCTWATSLLQGPLLPCQLPHTAQILAAVSVRAAAAS